ncbi:hypothetical protein EJ06DRAFT_473141 [Trichodelitschia bisporula]|uniref:HIG1 domain-containing protein n=1 Tax=Trichodelitschia bisporula TaxID=703511 RepID=A0A6G1I343_9PEZI|nr:hypothetical protein EJ06DRAFT_473141 [Trichodelitschia bisporula]
MSGDNPLPSSFDGDTDFYSESPTQKLLRRLKQEPLVPLGCLATVAALIGASRAMRVNDHARANIMFRRRIYAQGFTLFALVVGSAYWSRDREARKEVEGAEKERVARERREKWLQELEARDEEDKAERARRRARREERGGTGVVEAVERAVEGKAAQLEEKGDEKKGGIMDSVKGLWGGK